MEIKRADIFLADLNPVRGTEQAGIRPVLVVQIDKANKVSPHTIIIPFTTRIREEMLPSHTKIPAGVGGACRKTLFFYANKSGALIKSGS